MEISENTVNNETFDSIMNYYKIQLQEIFDSANALDEEGILYRILELASSYELNIQKCLNYLIKQYDADSSDILQDALYERIGVQRLGPQKAAFTLSLSGIPYSKIAAGEILLCSQPENYEFKNSENFQLDENGLADVSFLCTKEGEIPLTQDMQFKIVRAPVLINGITSGAEIDNILTGENRETDKDYASRYRKSKAINSKATHNADMAFLSEYVDDMAFLKINDKKTDNTIASGNVKIIAKPNVSDYEFASAILNCIGLGIKFTGNTSVNVLDNKGVPVCVKFQKATEIPVEIFVSVEILSTASVQEISDNITSNILDYVEKRVFGLESSIYATEFAIPVFRTAGVMAIESIKIKKYAEAEYSDVLNLSEDEAPVFSKTMITIETE